MRGFLIQQVSSVNGYVTDDLCFCGLCRVVGVIFVVYFLKCEKIIDNHL